MATSELLPTDKVITDRTSRFRSVRTLRDGANEFFETYDFHQFPEGLEDSYHTVLSGQEGRLDLIAFEHYRNPALWWVIAEANDLSFPPTDVIAGLVLRVPAQVNLFGA